MIAVAKRVSSQTYFSRCVCLMRLIYRIKLSKNGITPQIESSFDKSEQLITLKINGFVNFLIKRRICNSVKVKLPKRGRKKERRRQIRNDRLISILPWFAARSHVPRHPSNLYFKRRPLLPAISRKFVSRRGKKNFFPKGDDLNLQFLEFPLCSVECGHTQFCCILIRKLRLNIYA